MKIPQVKPDWNTGIYIGNGVVAKEPTDEIAQMQKEYEFFSNMLKTLERKKKNSPGNWTPGNGFAKMKCRERIASLEAAFDKIDYMTQVVYD